MCGMGHAIQQGDWILDSYAPLIYFGESDAIFGFHVIVLRVSLAGPHAKAETLVCVTP